MKRLDLDDLPPRIAAQLRELTEGEEVLLVQAGVAVGGLTATSKPAAACEPSSDLAPGEIFEQFRSAIEDEF